MFDNISEFKQDLIPLLKDFYIKPVLVIIKNPKDNAQFNWVHQVILNMLVTKNLANEVFDYIYTWGETQKYIGWAIRGYYHSTIQDTTGQAVFGRHMIFKLASVIEWRIITKEKQW